jgi:hypothetical protein
MGTVRQIEVPGTERNYSTAMREKGDALAAAIKAKSRADSKRKEAEAVALDPPFKLDVRVTKRVKKTAYKPPKQEGEPEEE